MTDHTKKSHNFYLVPKTKNLLHANYFYQLTANNVQSHARAIIVEKAPFSLSLQQMYFHDVPVKQRSITSNVLFRSYGTLRVTDTRKLCRSVDHHKQNLYLMFQYDRSDFLWQYNVLQ